MSALHFRRLLLLVLIAALASGAASAPKPAASRSVQARAAAPTASASGFLFYKFPVQQPLPCTGIGLNVTANPAYSRLDCGFVQFQTTGVSPTDALKVRLYNPAGAMFAEVATAPDDSAAGAYQFNLTPAADWPAGLLGFKVVLGAGTLIGAGSFSHNALGATLAAAPKGNNAPYAPGEAIPVSGSVHTLDTNAQGGAATAAAGGATFKLVVIKPGGQETAVPGAVTAGQDGTFSATIPAGTTAGVQGSAGGGFQVSLAIEARDAAYSDAEGAWASRRAGAGAVSVGTPPTGLQLENSFVSSVGWVKPDAAYPFRVFVRNYAATGRTGAVVKIPAPDGTGFLAATTGSGTAAISPTSGTITWNIGAVPAAAADGTPSVATLIVQAQADSLAEDPQVVWKDLSSTATLTYAGQPAGTIAAASHGPKVIPVDRQYDTARYGDRPFPVVPVDWADRKHEAAHTGDLLSRVLNDPTMPGSTFNLYQEMSYGQLFPEGTVPSSNIATAGFDGYAPGFQFTTLQPQGTCKGVTRGGLAGTALYEERIVDGWYQMPGDTEYYGGDKSGSALIGALTGVGAAFDIDSACGPTGKAVYDAAMIADPEIDYSDYDTDKDGVVDFFMMVFVGLGGNGDSQLNGVPPYDNIWPHSSSLEFYYADADGQKGYVSDDQLKDLQGRPLFYTDASRTAMTTSPSSGIKVFVRVGPYNVNPESAIDSASVISHEYGHSLGLPDFYSLGGRETYGTWNLMASDHSQHMDVFGKQEMGWIVPRALKPGAPITVNGMRDSKLNTHRIDWTTPSGAPYTLSGPRVNNGEAYVANLPPRQLIDPAKIVAGASPTHVWWSQSGNDFGCAPDGGHNLDIALPGMAALPANTVATAQFKSLWDIEWDYDYGFVMISTDGGETYQSLASKNNYTTPASQNPSQNGCQAQYGNGITGSSGSYRDGTAAVDRLAGNYPDPAFITDTFDLPAAAAGQDDVVLRFSNATDPGLA
ncbi:MAG TPA: immune inhibitor A domain-containing protein, partial [Herpetosiphonaceae bacterium]|nr:immune inhibitor A domain-containing protein [Herpetosiphonaceae bacterium]